MGDKKNSVRMSVHNDETMRQLEQLLLEPGQIVIVMSGIPGVGKSSLKNVLLKLYKLLNLDGLRKLVVCSADDQFTDPDTKEYKFNPNLLKVAHDNCQKACREALKEGHNVIVDNCSLQMPHVKTYDDIAKAADARLCVIMFELPPGMSDVQAALALRRNTHGLPPAKLLSLIKSHSKRDIKKAFPCIHVPVVFTEEQFNTSKTQAAALPGASLKITEVNISWMATIDVHDHGMIKAVSEAQMPESAPGTEQPGTPGVTLAFNLKADKLAELAPVQDTRMMLHSNLRYTERNVLGGTVDVLAIDRVCLSPQSPILSFLQEKLESETLHYTLGISGDRPPFDAKLVGNQLRKKGKLSLTVMEVDDCLTI